MPSFRPELANNEIYHVIVRGVGDLPIFKNEEDYYRAIFSLYEFNTTKPVVIRERRMERRKIKNAIGMSYGTDSREPLAEILAFCFMPNHIHLLIRQISEKGITNFMRKFGTSYATYFNKKYNRKGHLFQSRFQAVHIQTDEQLKITFTYIHTNGISLIDSEWKEKGVQNFKKAIEFLNNYKWSSYLDYVGRKNFPSVTKRDFFIEIMGGEKGCRNFLEDWVRYKKDIYFHFSELP